MVTEKRFRTGEISVGIVGNVYFFLLNLSTSIKIYNFFLTCKGGVSVCLHFRVGKINFLHL